MGRNLTRWLIPLPAILFSFFPDQVSAEATYTTWTCTTDSGSWQMQQPEADYLAGLYPTWADCLNWQNGAPPEPYTWSYGASVTTTTSSTTTTTTSTTTTSTSTSTTSTTTTSTTTLPETTTSASTTTLPTSTTTTSEPVQTSTTTSVPDTTTTLATTTTTTTQPVSTPTQTTSTTDQPVAVPNTSAPASEPLPEQQAETTTTETTSETTDPTTSLPDTTQEPIEVETSVQTTLLEPVADTLPSVASVATPLNETETTSPLPQDQDFERSKAIVEPVFLVEVTETGEISEEVFGQILDEIAEAEPEKVVAIVEAILATNLTQSQAVELVVSPVVLEAITEEQAEQIFESVVVEELSAEQAEQMSEVLSEAPSKVKKTFEKVIDIFGSQFENYVPNGSNIPVSQRRSLVAIGGLLTMLPMPTTRISR